MNRRIYEIYKRGKMRIGIFCTASHPVPPVNYGGTQMVNWETAEALVELGHEVYLFAPEGSKTSANLIIIDSGWGIRNEMDNVNKYVAPMKNKLDVIIDTSAFGVPGRLSSIFPYVARMGGDPDRKYCGNFDRNIIFPSQHHFDFHNKGACSCSKKRIQNNLENVIIPKPVCYHATVSHAFDLPMHKQGEGEYYVYLGLFAEHKGTHLAVEFAKKAGVKLCLVGGQDLSSYFNTRIAQDLSETIQCCLPINFHDKWKVLSKAKAVIFPSTCEEGDPNVPKEALLVGTPVIALDGTVSEIVDDAVTGFICKDVDEMVEVEELGMLDVIEPEVCRQAVLKKFGLKKYIDKTLIALQRAIDGDVWI